MTEAKALGVAEEAPKRPDARPGEIDPLSEAVARNLRRIRTQRGHSLERLAKLSGVSRAMLSQIELGKSVPTISLLWKVARALEVPFAALTNLADNPGTVLVRATSTKSLSSADGGFTSRALFPYDAPRKTEFYELRLRPRGFEAAEPHAPGTTENLVVSEGSVEIEVGGTSYRLADGDAIFFEADVAHSYRNVGTGEARLFLVMTYVEVIG